ncbi:glycosyltransferase family 4 protein [Streptomyces formicae]|uniref:D-inositol 3-phosphate glycosyltransferase n=1 Tax=Streptomyces formicae TaxID=1616117 RepID=A0ABY3WR48_9ACTN|nr:glycosyltransferase family 4 protein [Streptomyces formicae]UNM15121.1 glycosyltransferase family 4 protein [Streptomyces formicae]
MKISFLIHTVYGIGGTIRTTLNLAEELADRHEVEIVSVFRHRDEPLFAIDPRISVVPLVDTRPASATNEKQHPLALRPAGRFPAHEARFKEYSLLTDERVRDHYAVSDADVVIGTRPGLVAYVAQFAPERAVLIGQEHMTHNHHKPALRAEMREHLAAIDAFVTVSEGDAAVWREHMPLPGTRVLSIANSVPEPMVAPSDLGGTTVVAAGRLSSEKQYDLLIEAFGKVVAERPEWTLRICGWGNQKERLRRRIDELGLYNSVLLMGPRSPIEPEWVKGAIAVSTSRHESFGMTLVEAMRCGLPVVSTDCDYGPREIVADGVDGLLVPVGDADAVAHALLRLIDDGELRRRMGAAARVNARRFDPGPVAKQYEELFAELGAGGSRKFNSYTESVTSADAGADPGNTGTDAESAGETSPGCGALDRTASASPAAGAASASPAAGAASASPAAGAAFVPVADCVAAPDGSLRVRLIAPESAAVAYPGLRLVCTHEEKGAEERVFPFRADGTVTVPSGEEFAEGSWICHADQQASGLRVGIRARAIDQRGSMDPAHRTGPGGVRHLVPYIRAPRNLLALRSWARPAHAEAGDIRIEGRHITVSGRLHGPTAEPAARPVLLLRRGGEQPAELEFPGVRQGADGFRATLACTDAVRTTVRATVRARLAGKEGWELWLRYAPDADAVRVGRILDDVVAKSSVVVYPPVLLPAPRPFLLLRRALCRLRGRRPQLVSARLAHDRQNALILEVSDQ